LWSFVHALPKHRSDDIDQFRSRIIAGILERLTIPDFAAHSFVPAWVPVMSLIDSIDQSDECLWGQCFVNCIPAVLLHHIQETVSYDAACACLELVAKFVSFAPDQSPVYPEFVAEVSVRDVRFLDDVIRLASMTYQRSLEPASWLAYSAEALSMDVTSERELRQPAKLFYASCLCDCFSLLSADSPLAIGIFVPLLCDLLPSLVCDSDKLINPIVRYIEDPDAPLDAECFARALEALEEMDWAHLPEQESLSASCLLRALEGLSQKDSTV
jgi:hypothetical protein